MTKQSGLCPHRSISPGLLLLLPHPLLPPHYLITHTGDLILILSFPRGWFSWTLLMCDPKAKTFRSKVELRQVVYNPDFFFGGWGRRVILENKIAHLSFMTLKYIFLKAKLPSLWFKRGFLFFRTLLLCLFLRKVCLGLLLTF